MCFEVILKFNVICRVCVCISDEHKIYNVFGVQASITKYVLNDGKSCQWAAVEWKLSKHIIHEQNCSVIVKYFC